jgi:hypothetical protein
MPRRASRWIIFEKKDGTFDLMRGGRYLYTGLNRVDVFRRLKMYYKAGEPVQLEAPDGYRTNITNQLKRGGII